MLTSIRSRIRALVLYSFAGRACHSEYSASGRNHQFSLLIHLHGLERRPSPLHLVRNWRSSPRPNACL
jgi:hypothetical protein